ncbi:MAG TPA: HNH endonuclease [Candidatus Scalindua sp.]|nr:HNH endonuclease [Candidatus Scalindua sp.]
MTRGKANAMWKGGVADYPNHYEMKKNRLLKLQQTNGRCEICGDKAYQIHHKDFSKNNHSLKNLLILCRQCHAILHKGSNTKRGKDRKKSFSKFRRLYGFTRQELLDKSDLSIYDFNKLYRKGKLKNYLKAKQATINAKSKQ